MQVLVGKIIQIMKSKNILITIMVAMFLFGACTEEKIIDGPETVGKGSITLELAPSSIITKAGDTNGYTYATEEELTVTSCWVYIVEGDNIVRKMYFSGEDITGTSGPYSDEINGKENTYTKGYQVIINNLDYGTYDFWVIANPSGGQNEAKYSNCATLEDLKKIIEGADTYADAFASSSKLIKYGSKPVDFNADFVKAGNKIEVEMTQLAARVEVTVKVDLKWKPIGEYYEYKTDNVFKEALSQDEAYKLSDKTISSGGGSPITIIQNDGYKYLGHPVIGTKVKHYVVSEIEVQKVSKYEGYAITDLVFTIENIRTKSFVTVPAKGENDSDDGSVKVYKTKDFSFSGIQETYNIVFYTYNRKVDARNPLNVVLNGKIGFTKFDVKEKGVDTRGGYFVADKVGSYVKKIKNNELGANEVITLADNGWGNDAYMIYITKDENFNFLPSGEPGEVIGETPVWQNYTSAFKIEAPKDITEGNIRNGNLYTVSAVIQTVPTTGDLGVEIEGIKAFGPDIKFEFN